MSKVWISDRWQGAKTGAGLRWRVVWIDPETSRERSKSFKKKPEAEAHRTFLENSLRQSVYVSPEDAAKTVADAAEAWLKSKKKQKPSALARYRDALENYVLPRWGSTRLSAVKREDIDAWVADLMAGTAPRREGMRGPQKPLAPAGVHAVSRRLNSVLLHAVREGWIRRNPGSGVETPRIESDPIIFLDYQQLEHLIATTRTVASAQDALMIALMGNVGLRPGEVVALQVGDVDLERRRISISRTMTIDENDRPVRGTTTKTPAGNRLVPIPPHLLDDLRQQMGERPAHAVLFPNRAGNEQSLSNWRHRVWSKVTTAANMPEGLTPKGLRHTAASLAIASGADVLMVQRMLGHADATETLNTYAKLFPDRMDDVMAKMSEARAKAFQSGQILTSRSAS